MSAPRGEPHPSAGSGAALLGGKFCWMAAGGSRKLPSASPPPHDSVAVHWVVHGLKNCSALGHSWEPPAANSQSSHPTKRLPSRRWDMQLPSRAFARQSPNLTEILYPLSRFRSILSFQPDESRSPFTTGNRTYRPRDFCFN